MVFLLPAENGIFYESQWILQILRNFANCSGILQNLADSAKLSGMPHNFYFENLGNSAKFCGIPCIFHIQNSVYTFYIYMFFIFFYLFTASWPRYFLQFFNYFISKKHISDIGGRLLVESPMLPASSSLCQPFRTDAHRADNPLLNLVRSRWWPVSVHCS